MDAEPTKLLLTPEAAGVTGSLLGLRFAPGNSWMERIGNVLIGAACAAFIAPALVDWMHIESKPVQMGAAFMIGLFALSLCAAIIQAIRDLKLGEIITGWISRR